MKIEVKAIGVNRADVFFLEGKYPAFGLELAGIDKEGRRIAAIVNGGAYAKEVIVDECGAVEIPEIFSFAEAASIIEALFTAYYNLVELCKLKPNEKVLIHGGASGVGVVAIQLAKILGAEVYATAGKKKKLDLIKSLGAHAIDYKKQDFSAFNFDVILDIVGAEYFTRNISALNVNGRLAIISFIGGIKVSGFNLSPLLTKSLSIFSSTIRGLDANKKAEVRDKIIPYLPMIKPIIAKEFPFSKKHNAIEYVRDYKNVGKVVVTID